MNPIKNTSDISFEFGEESHPGKRRSENQDSVAHGDTPSGLVFVLSDGVGGYVGGAEAARIVTSGFLRHMKATAAGTDPEAAVREAAARVNSEVFAAAQSGDPSRRRMSATLVFALLSQAEGQAEAYIGNLGDSRAYIARNNTLSQITTDHTAAQSLVAAGLLPQAAAENHPEAGTLSKSVGRVSSVNMPIWRVALEPGARLLLCSDGLHASVKQESIRQVMTDTRQTPGHQAKTLLNLALDAGGPDNISIQVIQAGAATGGFFSSLHQRRAWLAAGGGVAFAALSWGGVALYQAWQVGGTHQQPASVQSASPIPIPAIPKPPASQAEPPRPTTNPYPDSHPQSKTPVNQPAPAPPEKLKVVAVAPLPKEQGFLKQFGTLQPLNPGKNKTCIQQESDHPVAYYRPELASRKGINLATIPQTYAREPYSSTIEDACGSYDLLFLPAKSSPEDVVRKNLQKDKKKVEDEAHRAIDAASH